MGVTQGSSWPGIMQLAQARETYKQEDAVSMLKQNGEIKTRAEKMKLDH